MSTDFMGMNYAFRKAGSAAAVDNIKRVFTGDVWDVDKFVISWL